MKRAGPHHSAVRGWGCAVRRGLVALIGPLALGGLGLTAGHVAAQADTATARVLLVCEAAYLPTRSVWRRTVEIEHNDQRVLRVRIDGIEVFTFAVQGTLILTGLDNERIQIDTASRIWTSDFRGVATSRGHCERAR